MNKWNFLFALFYTTISYLLFYLIEFPIEGIGVIEQKELSILYRIVIVVISLLFISSFRKISFKEFLLFDLMIFVPIFISTIFVKKNLNSEMIIKFFILFAIIFLLTIPIIISNQIIYYFRNKRRKTVQKNNIFLVKKSRLKRIKN